MSVVQTLGERLNSQVNNGLMFLKTSEKLGSFIVNKENVKKASM